MFAIYDMGFVARCALEEDDGIEFRLSRIERIIEECRYGVHDLSSAGLDARTGLPRFNMPLELGLFLGCERYGVPSQQSKRCLILDSDLYRYRTFISDLSGHDIHAHSNEPERAIREVRDWLQGASQRRSLQGGGEIIELYRRFLIDLPEICSVLFLEPDQLTFLDLSQTITKWLS